MAKGIELRPPLPAPLGLPPLLLVHGTDDDRVPFADIQGSVARLRAQGARVELRVIDLEDHFLFFDRDEEVLAIVEGWVRRVAATDARVAMTKRTEDVRCES